MLGGAEDVITIAAKQYASLLREYDKDHKALLQTIGLVQSLVSGEIDLKRVKMIDGGFELMPEQPKMPNKEGEK